MSQEETLPYHIEVLKKEFARRAAENPRYSLRAFAHRLEIHPSALCRILAMKQKLSPDCAASTITKLTLNEEEKRLFLQSVIDTRYAEESRELGAILKAPDLRPVTAELNTDACAEVFNLTAHAVLMLTFVEDFESSPQWIAARLNKPVDEIQRTVDALLKLGLLKQTDGRLVNTEYHFSAVKNKETDRIRREHQKEIVTRAVASLDRDDFEKRAHYGVTMTINPEKIPKAREMILKFLENLNDLLESGERRQVYQAAFQLFPVDYPEDAKPS